LDADGPDQKQRNGCGTRVEVLAPYIPGFLQVAPKQLSPAEQEFPQWPQFKESLKNVALFTYWPMQLS
jgi:hypothetical protein